MQFKKSMAASKEKSSENLDLLLPTPVLCSIISLLPTKEAVATSLVCRRWRYLWCYLTRLDLDPSSMASSRVKRVRSGVASSYKLDRIVLRTIRDVDQLLHSQRYITVISSCRIVLPNEGWVWEAGKRWIEFLKTETRLEELLIVREQKDIESPLPAAWPSGFFCGENLRILELTSDEKIDDASPFEGCGNLKILKLHSVTLTDETLAAIIDNCMILENLVLIDCKGLVDVKILDKGLKYLEIQDLHLKGFELRAGSLRVLSLTNFSCSLCHIGCPNIDVLRVSVELVRDSEKIASSEVLLARFTGLIVYQDHHHHILPYPNCLFWVGVLLEHLKVVQIRGFRGTESEMLLVTHLIENAEGLEKLVIQFDNACLKLEEEARQKLLSLPRASINLSIVLIHKEN